MAAKTRWVEVATQASSERFKCLSEQLQNQSIENEYSFVEFDEQGKWLESLNQDRAQIVSVRLGRGLGEVVLEEFPNHSVHINKLGAADTMLWADGQWWLRSAIYEGLLRVFSGVGESLNFESSALVVGAGPMARTAIGVLFREGFKNFGVSAIDAEKGERLVSQLRRVYFGAEFEFIPKDELILLPGRYGIIANTTPSIEGNALLAELSYFNFFIPNGVAIDLYMAPGKAELLEGAKEVGAVTIPNYQVAAQIDGVWTEWAFSKELDLESYTERLKSKFQT